MRFLRPGAWLLLVAAMAMMIETSCSHAPAPDQRADPRAYEGEGVVVRFHTTDGITYVTSSYAVTDSSLVIRNILRDAKYYDPNETDLHEETPTPPPADIVLPVEVPMKNVRYMDRWEPVAISHDTTKGNLLMIGIVAGFVAAVAIAISKAND